MTPPKGRPDPNDPESKLTVRDRQKYLQYIRDENFPKGPRWIIRDGHGKPLRGNGLTKTGEIKSGVWFKLQDLNEAPNLALAQPVEEAPRDLQIPGAHFVPLGDPIQWKLTPECSTKKSSRPLLLDQCVQSPQQVMLQQPQFYALPDITVNGFGSQQTSSPHRLQPVMASNGFGSQQISSQPYFQSGIAKNGLGRQQITGQPYSQPGMVVDWADSQHHNAVDDGFHNFGYTWTDSPGQATLLPPTFQSQQISPLCEPHDSYAMAIQPGYGLSVNETAPPPNIKLSQHLYNAPLSPLLRSGHGADAAQLSDMGWSLTGPTPARNSGRMSQRIHSMNKPINYQMKFQGKAEAGSRSPRPATHNKRSASPGKQAAPTSKRSRLSQSLDGISIRPTDALDIDLDLSVDVDLDLSQLGDHAPISETMLHPRSAANQDLHRLSFQRQSGEALPPVPCPGAPRPRPQNLSSWSKTSFSVGLPSSSPTAQAKLRQRRLSATQMQPGAATSLAGDLKPQHFDVRHDTPTANGTTLVNPRHAIPSKFLAVFPYSIFNTIQSRCFPLIYESCDNVVVSAPTGSGKTVLFELAICRLANQTANDNAKAVYIAPTKALCKEKAGQWRRKFGMLSSPIAELTGDTSRAEMKNVREAKIIVTTPEKWDSITRSWADHGRLLDLVELFLIDEVHILKESRGATLEAIVSRMKTYGTKIRFVALSATVPNSQDIATWLGKNHIDSHAPAHIEIFGEEHRPVKLHKVVHGLDSKLGHHPFDKYLNNQLWKLIAMHSQKKPMLVFCMTRKSCHEAAEVLAKEWSQRHLGARLWPEPTQRIPVTDAKLQELVRSGVAFHHAGLDSGDRQAIQQAFEQGILSVICCTSTLAVGINLPCHTVVLKGTVGYQDGGQPCEYSDLEVMQMLGRAGRPQFENNAVAIILTQSRNKKRYEDLGSGKQILESTLHKNLIEHLNSEIGLGTFETLQGAKNWLNGTFLSVRLRQNPKHYSELDERIVYSSISASTIDEKLERICEGVIENLRGAQLVECTRTSSFHPTEYGRAMSKYMIRYDTMKLILVIPRGATTQDLLTTLCGATEFSEFRWQTNEREIFRDINKDPFIMYPIESNVASIAHKVSLLIQMELGHVEPTKIPGADRSRLRAETNRAIEVMHRLIRAVIECKGSPADMDGRACCAALEFARSIKARAWEGKTMQLLQVPQIGQVLMRKLVQSNIKTVAALAATDASTIERIASRNPPFGKKMTETVASFPKLTLDAKIKGNTNDADGRPLIHIDAVLGYISKRGKWQGKVPIVTFLAVTTEGVSAYFWRGSLNRFKDDRNTQRIHFTWAPDGPGEKLVGYFACEEIVGTVVCVELHHELLARSFPPKHRQPRKPPVESHNAKLMTVAPSHLPLDDDVDDDDLLDLLKTVEPAVSFGEENFMAHEVSDDPYPIMDRDGMFEKDASTSPENTQNCLSNTEHDEVAVPEAVRFPNGRYKCGHPCSQASVSTTAQGHACGHDCCRNGSKYPPKKRGGSSKRRAQDEDAVSNMSASVRRPSISMASARDAKISKTKAVTSASTPHAHITGVSQSTKKIDLSAFEMDDEGLIDLTGEDVLLEEGDLRDITKTKRLNNPKPIDGRKHLRPEEPNTDYMVEDLSDRDFIDLHDGRQVEHGNKHRSQSTRDRVSSTDRFNDTGTMLMLEQAEDSENEHKHVGLSPRNASVRHAGRSKIVGESQFSHEQLHESLQPTTTTAEEIMPNEDVPHTSCDEPDRPGTIAPESQQKVGEPEWLNEFDSALIDGFRGLVDFI